MCFNAKVSRSRISEILLWVKLVLYRYMIQHFHQDTLQLSPVLLIHTHVGRPDTPTGGTRTPGVQLPGKSYTQLNECSLMQQLCNKCKLLEEYNVLFFSVGETDL